MRVAVHSTAVESSKRAAIALCKQGNFLAAKTYIAKAQHYAKRHAAGDLGMGAMLKLIEFQIEHAESLKGQLLGATVEKLAKHSKQLKQLQTAWSKPGKFNLLEDPMLSFRFHNLRGEILNDLGSLVEENPSVGSHASKAGATPAEIFGEAGSHFDLNCRRLGKIILGNLGNGNGRTRTSTTLGAGLQSETLVSMAASSYFRYAQFCKARYEVDREGSKGGGEDNDNLVVYRRAFVESVLQAVRHGASDATMYLPKVVEMIRADEESRQKFSALARTIPCWRFIRWASQMLATLKEAADDASMEQIVPILKLIARHYPQSLYYSFNISHPVLRKAAARAQVQAARADGRAGRAPRGLMKHLDDLQSLLRNPLVDKFIAALDMMTAVPVSLKNLSSQIATALGKNSQEGRLEAQALYDGFYNKCVGSHPVLGRWIARDTSSDYQKFFKRILPAKQFGPPSNRGLIRSAKTMNKRKFRGVWSKALTQLVNHPEVAKRGASSKLKDYSMWLYNYERHSSGLLEYLEVPGQYSGREMPQPERHVKIVNFGPRVMVILSKQKPKRVTVHGNDERDYNFLVKGGEDLRLDQRIEQLFAVMNDIVQQEPQCAKRRLQIRTYEVIPMTDVVGLLQWVPNSIPVKNALEDELKRRGLEDISCSVGHDVVDAARKLVRKSASTTAQQLWGHIFTASDEPLLRIFRDSENQVPEDLLCSVIKMFCSSPEAYILVRARFARSFAAFSICGYILGIGDRHLANYLLSKEDGAVVGIDFGYSFGQGVLLPVPEIVPFRMTRQFRNLLRPLDSDGLVKQDMARILHELRVHRDVLLSVLEVFVQEPLLEWQSAAEAKAQSQGCDVSWYPEEKVRIAKMKLEGVHPSRVLLRELKQHSRWKDAQFQQTAISLVKGVRGKRPAFRSRTHYRKCETAREQVDHLMDLATDPKIISRVWIGWAPYL